MMGEVDIFALADYLAADKEPCSAALVKVSNWLLTEPNATLRNQIASGAVLMWVSLHSQPYKVLHKLIQ